MKYLRTFLASAFVAIALAFAMPAAADECVSFTGDVDKAPALVANGSIKDYIVASGEDADKLLLEVFAATGVVFDPTLSDDIIVVLDSQNQIWVLQYLGGCFTDMVKVY